MPCEWQSIEIMELNAREDHDHVVVSILLKISISEAVGILKGKAAIKNVQKLFSYKAENVLGKPFLEPRI